MSEKKKTARDIVEEVLTPARTRELWTANYFPALPFTPQDFEIGSLLPAMLYMARWGHRRGKGKFADTFGHEEKDKKGHTKKVVFLEDVAKRLLMEDGGSFEGFADGHGHTMLADLLLTYCLENKDHELGHQQQVQRVFPTHYLASWLDLPKDVGNLRGVPELLTALLAWQDKGETLQSGSDKPRFPVGAGNFTANPLLSLFARSMAIHGPHASQQASDRFLEEEANNLGIDELLSVRLAQACGHAPDKTGKGKGESAGIPNRWPIADEAAKHLRRDLATFVEVYGSAMPRQSFLPMLEAGIGLGMANLLLSTAACLLEWERTGTVPKEQAPMPLFVDCSHGLNKRLRQVSEATMGEVLARYERLPVLLMLLRVLDDRVRHHPKLKNDLPSQSPDARAWLDLMGGIYHQQHGNSDSIMERLDEDCIRLSDELESVGEAQDVVRGLRANNVISALRLAEGIVELHGYHQQGRQVINAFDSALMPNRPNGLAFKRRVSRAEAGTKKSIDLRSIVLSHSLLDFLVHRHLRKDGKGKTEQPLSLRRFLDLLRGRYGLHVDREPPGMAVPQELLRENKLWLERRLRDLGLLVGVNDAESMKQLRARFEVPDQEAAA